MVEANDYVWVFRTPDGKTWIEESAEPEVNDYGVVTNVKDKNVFMTKSTLEVGDYCRVFKAGDNYFARGKTYWCPKAIGYYTTLVDHEGIETDPHFNSRFVWTKSYRIGEYLCILLSDDGKMNLGSERDVFEDLKENETFVNNTIANHNNLYNHNSTDIIFYDGIFDKLYEWDFLEIKSSFGWIKIENWDESRVKIETSIDGNNWNEKFYYQFAESAAQNLIYSEGFSLDSFRYVRLSGSKGWIHFSEVLKEPTFLSANTLSGKKLNRISTRNEPLYGLFYPEHPSLKPQRMMTLNGLQPPEPSQYSYSIARQHTSLTPDQYDTLFNGFISLFKDEEIHISLQGTGGQCFIKDGIGPYIFQDFPCNFIKSYSEVKKEIFVVGVKADPNTSLEADLIIWLQK